MKQTARIFKALADETRLRILTLLLVEGELCVCDLMAALQMPQSTVSRHLAYLRTSGLVDDRRAGIWMYYSIAGDLAEITRSTLQQLKEIHAEEKSILEDRERLRKFVVTKSCA